ncbi:MAG: cytochrome c family protein [candidate division Zixibacteria bacterium]|nr:cytochrome c family protein [candidate division Zixibacteria bacterium]MDH3935750.1 cytochrome c family protein [candidate division Zixibacteria bacterium]MDH4032547.1 cytochrome c family protein [candidate division Zixibacteria bacterium]
MISFRSTIPIIVAVVILAQANVGQCQSYRVCKECHSDIFELWKNSLHAKSYENPTFRATYMTARLDRGDEVAQKCLACHAPMANDENGHDPDAAGAEEGVTCSFCHSISSVGEGGIDTYYNLDTTGAVYGPYRATQDVGHETKYSPLYLESRLCAGCHEYVNSHGVRVLDTYKEWEESPYRKNDVHCQNCHMPTAPLLSVADDYDVTGYYVTAHEFRGGHSNINLAHAVKLETAVTKRERKLEVLVMITNAESGHMLPTGIPIRSLALNVVLKSAEGIELSAVRKVYRKVLTDAYGTIIENALDMFLNATDVYSDNRIGPKETRVETLTFEIPKKVKDYYVETTLNYEYSRPVLIEEFISIEMAKQVVNSRSIR